MIAQYTCSYLHNSGIICGRFCTRPQGCSFHWKCKQRLPCSECGKPTGSASGTCKKHAKGYYVVQYYIRKFQNTASN